MLHWKLGFVWKNDIKYIQTLACFNFFSLFLSRLFIPFFISLQFFTYFSLFFRQSCFSIYKKHVKKTHLGIRPYLCQVCGQSFGEDSELKAHINSLHPLEKNYKCEYCGYATSVKCTFQSKSPGDHFNNFIIFIVFCVFLCYIYAVQKRGKTKKMHTHFFLCKT